MSSELYILCARSQIYTERSLPKRKYHFCQLCREVTSLEKALRKIMSTIQELELDTVEWEIDFERGHPFIKATDRKGRQKSGRPKKFDWGECALELSIYLRTRTRQPHYATIAQLLYFAGYEEFYGIMPGDKQPESKDTRVIQQEVDKIRRRIEDLQKDDKVMYAVCARLRDYESAYETRPHLSNGDMKTLIGKVFGPP